MLIYFIQTLICVASFGFIFFNHKRISTIQFSNDELILDTKMKINALNTVLLKKYEQKQNIDSKIMKIIINKLNSLSSKMNTKDVALELEVESLRKTLIYLQDQKTLFYQFDEEST
jgi:hypothetical protein